MLSPGKHSTGREVGLSIKVLSIDDDIEMTDLLRLLLDPGAYDFTAANSVTEGIDFVRRSKPDVVILDLFMPGMDGWQACKEIRKFSQVPILILSVNNTPGMVARALDAGADDYLVKPVTSGVLMAHLNRLVRRARMEEHARNPALRLSTH